MTPSDLLGSIKDTRDLNLIYPRNLELLDGPLAPAVILDRLAFAPPRTGLRFKVHTSVTFTRDYKEILVTTSATRTHNAA